MFEVRYQAGVYLPAVTKASDLETFSDALREAARSIDRLEGRAFVVDQGTKKELAIIWGGPGSPKRVRTLDDNFFPQAKETVQRYNRQFVTVERRTDRLSKGLVLTLEKVATFNRLRGF